MDIKNVLTYLKEELKDIPARPDNIHYTDFEHLYYILQTGLKGQDYVDTSDKIKKGDRELATVRGSHELTDTEIAKLSSNTEKAGVRINLFTNRILASHRGTRKATVAELPAAEKRYIHNDKERFKKNFGYDVPDLTTGPNHYYDKELTQKRINQIKDWMKENNHPISLPAVKDIHYINFQTQKYYRFLREREREERFLLKKNIPMDPNLLEILIIKEPDEYDTYDDEFMEKTAKNYLELVEKNDGVFVHNKNFRLFKNYLRSKING